ncbi:MAG: hypothetical protein TYPL_1110 [Candidatus Tyloplasma litorale]|nr:MAG: hypothetical protein TYPL_1110 [Mycoplasmatales bacterium]
MVNRKIKLLQPSKIKISKSKTIAILTSSAIISAFAIYYFIVAAQLYVPGLAGLSNGISYTINDIAGNWVNGGGDWGSDNFSRATADTIIYWIIYILFNIPVIIFTIRWYSRRFFFLSIYYFFINFIASMFFSNVPGFNSSIIDISNDITDAAESLIVLMYALIGGLIYGIAIGMAFKVGACTMGLDPVAKFIAREKNMNIAPILFVFTIINTTVWIVIRYWTIPIHNSNVEVVDSFDNFIQNTFLSANYVGSWLFVGVYSSVTGAIYASNKKVQVFVTTQKTEKISDYFNSISYHRGHTIFNVQGGYSKESKKSLQMIVNIEEMYDVVEKIAAIDNKAFITIQELKKVYDVRDWRTMTEEDKAKELQRIKNEEKRRKRRETKSKVFDDKKKEKK